MQTLKPKNSIKDGDIFVLGDHLLACGDSRDVEIINAIMKNRSVQLILSDPPYGVSFVESKESFSHQKTGHKVIANDHEQTDAEYRTFTKRWIAIVIPFLSKKNAMYIFNSDRMLFALREGMLDAACKFSQLLIWIKNQPVIGRMDYLPQHELIAYGWHGTHEFMKSKDKSVIFCPKTNKNTIHPTMKPVSLLRTLILNSSRTGDTVYDPFAGSGSTLIACEQTKRKCITIELDPKYCQVIIDRFEKLTGLKATKLPNPKPNG